MLHHGSPPVSRPDFSWLPKRGSLGINTTEQNEGKQGKKSLHPQQLSVWDQKLNQTCTPELFCMRVFLSLSLEITSVLSRDSNNHQPLRLCDHGVKVCYRYGPGGGCVSVWLQQRSDALPASRCFMFRLRALWEEVCWQRKQGHLESTVQRHQDQAKKTMNTLLFA